MRTQNGRAMINMDSANLSIIQHCPHRVHYAVDNSAEHYCQSAANKGLVNCGPWPGRCSTLTSCPIVSRKHFVPVTSLCWVSNGSKHKHAALYNIVSWARRPLARIFIANNVLPRRVVWDTKKASSADDLAVLSNAQRNATHRMLHSTVVKSFLYSSLFVS